MHCSISHIFFAIFFFTFKSCTLFFTFFHFPIGLKNASYFSHFFNFSLNYKTAPYFSLFYFLIIFWRKKTKNNQSPICCICNLLLYVQQKSFILFFVANWIKKIMKWYYGSDGYQWLLSYYFFKVYDCSFWKWSFWKIFLFCLILRIDQNIRNAAKISEM